jgi:hypothetical protein
MTITPIKILTAHNTKNGRLNRQQFASLPILQPSHRPRLRSSYDPPLKTEAEHIAMIEYNRENDPDFHEPPDKLPYGVFLVDDENQTQVLFDYDYRPIWKRHGESPAVPADPNEWINWDGVFWFWDSTLVPGNSPRLAAATAAVLDEFIRGGPLYVRRWYPVRPSLAGTFLGTVVQRVRTDLRSGLKIIVNMEA